VGDLDPADGAQNTSRRPDAARVILVVASYIRGLSTPGLKHPMLTGIKLGRRRICSPMAISLDHPVRFVPRMGGVRRISLKASRRQRGAADPVAAPATTDCGGGRDVAYLALAFAFHPVVIGVPVFGV